MVKHTSPSDQQELFIKDLKLNSLLEVTQAINANLPEVSLYKIFQFTLLANLSVQKLALYVKDEDWICKINFGTQKDYFKQPLNDEMLSIHESSEIKAGGEFSDFDFVIPVAHKERTLAYIFLQQQSGKGGVDTSFIRTFTNIILVAIENKKFARRELQQEALKKEMEIAREVQSHLFPKDLPQTPRISLQAFYLPHQTIGGDYYDYLPINEQSAIVCIADVSGKGVPAAILMSNVQASLRTMIRYTTDLKQIILGLNELILSHTKGERFVTLFLGLIDFERSELSYINAGHNPIPLIQGDEVILLDKGTTILGMLARLPFVESSVCALKDKNHLFLYTDGLSECMNEADEEFGLEKVLECVTRYEPQGQKEMIQSILSDTRLFKGARIYNDDITILSCVIQPGLSLS